MDPLFSIFIERLLHEGVLKDSYIEAIQISSGNCGRLQLLMGFPLTVIPVVDFRWLSVRNGCPVWFYLEPFEMIRGFIDHCPGCCPVTVAPCWPPSTEPPCGEEGSFRVLCKRPVAGLSWHMSWRSWSALCWLHHRARRGWGELALEQDPELYVGSQGISLGILKELMSITF